MINGPTDIGSLPGFPIRGNIVGFDLKNGIAFVQLSLTQSPTVHPVKLPAGWVGPRGQLSGGCPERGTSIFVIQGQGNEWMFIGYDQPDFREDYDGDGRRRVNPATKLSPGRWITAVENDINILVDPKKGVLQGGSHQFTQADQNLGIWSSKFIQQMHFTDAHREITGPILRDLRPNDSRNVSGSALSDHGYNLALDEIGLDPRTATSVSNADNRNPALTESRHMYYEFCNSFGYTDDQFEQRLYAGEDLQTTRPFQRKSSRTDAVSLSLDQPNFLAECIIGTVVDIYGNILDINRNILPSGLIESLSLNNAQQDQSEVFASLRAQLRKSIAYHFEINARKEGLNLPDYDSTINYARERSRFFFDIDKEGQFKMNVPASSEDGNISLLVRNENFSNLRGFEDDADRGQFMRNRLEGNNTDIQLEPHGVGAVTLVSNEESLEAFAAPLSRIDGEIIKLGTGFHDISGVLFSHKFEQLYLNNGGYPDSILNFVDPVVDVISSEVIVSGEGANAGGRSGTISLDGMLSMSIGANTIDRQSLWLDTAGGIVGAIGRDRFQRSMALTLDGDLMMEVGGPTIGTDFRFPSATFNNEARDGVIDIRVWNSGSFHTIRIDSQGISIHTPQRLDIVSESTIRIKSVNGDMHLDAENIYFYSDGDPSDTRLVTRKTEGSAGKTI